MRQDIRVHTNEGGEIIEMEIIEICIYIHSLYFVIRSIVSTIAGKCNYYNYCLLYTSPSPRDGLLSRMPSSA